MKASCGGRVLLPPLHTLPVVPVPTGPRPRPVSALRDALRPRRSPLPICRTANNIVASTAAVADFKAWENVKSLVPKRDDIKTIMLFGAGPIVIGQVSFQCRWCFCKVEGRMHCSLLQIWACLI